MIHLFEPHGDDALISCYPILRKSADSTVVVTVGQSRCSDGLKRHFPGLRTHYEGVYEIPNQIGRAAYLKGYQDWQKPSVLNDTRTPWQWQRDVTAGHNGELWKESWDLTVDFVTSYLDGLGANLRDRHLILGPVGLLHPYHICLADVIRRAIPHYPNLAFGLYSEAPYNSAKWVRALEHSHPYVSWGVKTGKLGDTRGGNDGRDEKTKEAIFRDVYPTEVKIFRFTREEVLNNPYHFYLPLDWGHII